MSSTPTRRYDSSRRRESAEATRVEIIAAAAELFAERGWAGTSMKDVAARARVSVETIYASIGNKKALLQVALDVGVVGDDDPVPLLERHEFQAMFTGDLAERASATGRLMLGINQRTAALYRALAHAAASDPSLGELLASNHADQRASNRYGLGAVSRREVTDAEVDACAAMLGPDVYLLLTQDFGWSGEDYAAWISHAVIRLFDLREDSPR